MWRFALPGLAGLLFMQVSASAQEAPTTLNLTCSGRGVYTVPNLDRDEMGKFKDDERFETEGRTRVRVTGNTVSVRLPSTMPGGQAWREMTDVRIDEDQISGKLRLSLFPTRVRIDRRTGDIDISGTVSFDGICEKAPDETGAPKF